MFSVFYYQTLKEIFLAPTSGKTRIMNKKMLKLKKFARFVKINLQVFFFFFFFGGGGGGLGQHRGGGAIVGGGVNSGGVFNLYKCLRPSHHKFKSPNQFELKELKGSKRT